MKKIFILFVVFIFISCDLILTTQEGFNPYTVVNYSSGIIIRCKDGFLVNDTLEFEWVAVEPIKITNVLNHDILLDLYNGDWSSLIVRANDYVLISI